MKTKKPDIFLGITMCMLVLAVVLCIVIMFVQKSDKDPKPVDPAGTALSTNADPQNSGETQGTGSVDTGTPVTPPVELKAIDEAGLKAALDESLKGLTSEWQVMVIDPAFDTHVSSTVNCSVEDWMTANRMTQVFIMATVFQQSQDGPLVLDEVLDDVKAMMNANDTYAADRLTERIGDGSATKGREAVKAFAVANGVKLGFNRPLTGTSGQKNYVTAQQTAEILNLICQGKLVNESASKQMLDILLTPVDNVEIDTGLTGDGIRCGFVNDVEAGVCICSMGVVQLPNRSFVISVVCNEPVTTDGAKNKVTDLISVTQPFFAE